MQAAGSLTSLYDLIRLSARAPRESRLCITGVSSDSGMRISFRKFSGCCGVDAVRQSADALALLRAIRQVISNAMAEVRATLPAVVLPPDLAAAACMDGVRDDPDEWLFLPVQVDRILHGAASRLAQEINITLGTSSAARDVRRAPADCWIDWIVFLAGIDSPHVRIMQERAQQAWERGQLTYASLRALLSQAVPAGDISGVMLWRKAQTLLAQCSPVAAADTPPQVDLRVPPEEEGGCPRNAEQFPYTQLNDNIYGRIFDSMLANYLLLHAPVQTLAATHVAAMEVAACLDRLPLMHKAAVMAEFTSIACSEKRFWMKYGEAAQKKLMEERLGTLRVLDILLLLKTPPRDGLGVMLRQYMMARLMVAMRDVNPDSVPWMYSSNMNYLGVIVEQSARIDKPQLDMGIREVRSGITLAYQPSLLTHGYRTASLRPAEYYLPDLRQPSAALKASLGQGQPYVSGVSGTTNLMLHLASYIRPKQALDIHHFWMSVMIFVVCDGGHSIHESLWVAHQLDGLLGLNLGLECGNDPLTYIGSTEQLERLFASTASAGLIRDAKQHAWRRTLDAFRIYSHYAGDQDAVADLAHVSEVPLRH